MKTGATQFGPRGNGNSAGLEIAVLVLTVVLLLPFLNKALTIDDPLFVWTAKHLVIHPLDPYGFEANWFGAPKPMIQNVMNPPLTSYWLALAGRFSWNEWWLHLWMLVWPVLLVWGVMRLAREININSFWAGMLTIGSSVVLVSATNLMCDVMMTALMTWGVVLWLMGLRRESWGLLTVSAGVIGLASLTKYFAIAAVPLLIAYTLMRDRRAWKYLPLLLVSVGTLAGWDLWTKHLYGIHHVVSAAAYAGSHGTEESPLIRAYASMTFLGGCLLWPLLVGWWRAKLPGRILIGTGFVVGPLGMWMIVSKTKGMLETLEPSSWPLSAVCFAAGVALLYLTSKLLLENYRDSQAWLLGLWILGTIVFTAFVNWDVSARNILPLVPPMALLAARVARSPNRAPALNRAGSEEILVKLKEPVLIVAGACGLVLAMVMSYADFIWANQVKHQANTLTARYHQGKVFFQGHWGWQYYMEQNGAIAVDFRGQETLVKDVIIAPYSNCNVNISYLLKEDRWKVLEVVREQERSPVGIYLTCNGRSGFYASMFGPMPLTTVKIPADRYCVIALAGYLPSPVKPPPSNR